MEENKQMKEINLTLPIKYSVTEKALTALAQEYAIEILPTDLEIKKNYDFIKLGVAKIRKFRGEVKARKTELNKDALSYQRAVNSAAKELLQRLLTIENPMKKLKTDFDTKKEIERREKIRIEEERVEKIVNRIAYMNNLVGANVSSKSDNIKRLLNNLDNDDVTEWAEEYTEKALKAKEETIAGLTELFNMKVQSEKADAERIAREQAEKEAAERLAEENKKKAAELKLQQAEMAKQQAEIEAQKAEMARQAKALEDMKEAAIRAEKEKALRAKQKEERIKKEKEKKERQEQIRKEEEKRQAQLKKEQEAKEKKAAVMAKANRKKAINTTAKMLTEYVVNEVTGTSLLKQIINGKFKHLKWID